MPETILFVDDEPRILQAYKRTLRKEFKIISAESGKEALALMESEGPFPVIVSDMQMPLMNGVELLAQVKEKYPDTVRIMLTGNADQQTARDAINKGDVYRFLNKPCPPEEMVPALKAALQFYEVLQAEHNLLEQTVKGSIKALVETLSIVSPEVFGRATIVRRYMAKIAKAININVTWEIEAVALLSQMGTVTLPESLLARVLKGDLITKEEQDIYDKHPEVCAKLINRIPRLENIAEAIRCQNLAFFNDSIISGTEIPLAARMLKPLLDFTILEAAGLSSEEALVRLKVNDTLYDPEILDAMNRVLAHQTTQAVKKMSVTQLQEGMRIADDVITFSGVLLVRKGQDVGASLVMRLVNFYRNNEISEDLMVFVD